MEELSNLPSQEIRKRILFLGFLAGAMLGIAIYLVFKVLQSGSYVLLAALLPMAFAAVPMMKRFGQLQALRKSRAHDGAEGDVRAPGA